MSQQLIAVERPLCPKCGSNANVKLNGWNEIHDRRQYYCKVDKIRFVYPRKPREKGTFKRGLSIKKKEASTRMMENRSEYLLKLNIDLVANVPCFVCEVKICNPETCDFMDLWLDGIETITKVCAYCHREFEGRLNPSEFCSSNCEILYVQEKNSISSRYRTAYSSDKRIENEENEMERLSIEGLNYEKAKFSDFRRRNNS